MEEERRTGPSLMRAGRSASSTSREAADMASLAKAVLTDIPNIAQYSGSGVTAEHKVVEVEKTVIMAHIL